MASALSLPTTHPTHTPVHAPISTCTPMSIQVEWQTIDTPCTFLFRDHMPRQHTEHSNPPKVSLLVDHSAISHGRQSKLYAEPVSHVANLLSSWLPGINLLHKRWLARLHCSLEFPALQLRLRRSGKSYAVLLVSECTRNHLEFNLSCATAVCAGQSVCSWSCRILFEAQ